MSNLERDIYTTYTTVYLYALAWDTCISAIYTIIKTCNQINKTKTKITRDKLTEQRD